MTSCWDGGQLSVADTPRTPFTAQRIEMDEQSEPQISADGIYLAARADPFLEAHLPQFILLSLPEAPSRESLGPGLPRLTEMLAVTRDGSARPRPIREAGVGRPRGSLSGPREVVRDEGRGALPSSAS